jgi:uncharacterized protein HemY
MDEDTQRRTAAVVQTMVKEVVEARAALARGDRGQARSRVARAQNIATRALRLLSTGVEG